MTREEQQAIFDAIRERSDRPGTFNAVNGVRLTALSDGGAEGEVRLTARHLNPRGIVHGGGYCTRMDQVAHLHLPHEGRLPGGMTSPAKKDAAPKGAAQAGGILESLRLLYYT